MECIESKKVILNPSELNWIGIRFFDRMGRVFKYNGQYYRAIYPHKVDYVMKLLQSGLVEDLVGKGLLVETRIAEMEVEGFGLVLWHRAAPFPTNPLVWNRGFIRDAALCGINLNLELLKCGLGTIDFTPNNIQQRGNCSPVWIDFGSICPLSSVGVQCGLSELKNYFLNPLYVLSQKKSLNDICRKIIHYSGGLTDEQLGDLVDSKFFVEANGRKELLEAIREWLTNLSFPDLSSKWQAYQPDINISNLNFNNLRDKRAETVYRVIKHYKPEKVVDLSCNAGYFSLMAATMGTQTYAIDMDEGAIERLYHYAKQVSEPISLTAAVGDVLTKRDVKADLVLAPALSHHIAISQGFPFTFIAERFSSYSTDVLLTDFMANGLGGTTPQPNPLPQGYNLRAYVEAFAPYFRKVETIYSPAPLEWSFRILVLCSDRKEDGELSETEFSTSIVRVDPNSNTKGLVYRIICPYCEKAFVYKADGLIKCPHCSETLRIDDFAL
ncbi:MAG: hypothetical protein KAV87_15605 [Desulfobacteraceae bacterium]|nr:hypothetical protein [Desulfobacteraceae bacterium]